MWTQTAICMTFSRLRTASAIPLQSKKRPPAAHGACVHGLVKDWRYPSRKAEQKSRKRSLLSRGRASGSFVLCSVLCFRAQRPLDLRKRRDGRRGAFALNAQRRGLRGVSQAFRLRPALRHAPQKKAKEGISRARGVHRLYAAGLLPGALTASPHRRRAPRAVCNHDARGGITRRNPNFHITRTASRQRGRLLLVYKQPVGQPNGQCAFRARNRGWI